MSTRPDSLTELISALPPALPGLDTPFLRLLGSRQAEDLRQLFDTASRPQPVSWQVLASPAPLPLEAEERRLVHAFAYLLTERKKSTPRYQKMQALYQKYASEDLAEMLLSYQLAWSDLAKAEAFGRELLQSHPDSLGLRLNLTLLLLARQAPEAIEALLDSLLQWPDFLAQHPRLAASITNIRLFHTITCLYFAHCGRFREAAFACAVCHEAGGSQQELLTLAHAIERQLSVRDQWQSLVDWLSQDG
ncbi:MAG: hypothetical protein CVV27_02200 [Candidatus Melainabacteria bacterium HGW-Melainabacteria-1]|nr:MAG: hypothetical protein CVV27_02200 [Candidatus Melainabacteria bacterium HGW-Melainabacteria-1]